MPLLIEGVLTGHTMCIFILKNSRFFVFFYWNWWFLWRLFRKIIKRYYFCNLYRCESYIKVCFYTKYFYERKQCFEMDGPVHRDCYNERLRCWHPQGDGVVFWNDGSGHDRYRVTDEIQRQNERTRRRDDFAPGERWRNMAIITAR